MEVAAKALDFIEAAKLRDEIAVFIRTSIKKAPYKRCFSNYTMLQRLFRC